MKHECPACGAKFNVEWPDDAATLERYDPSILVMDDIANQCDGGSTIVTIGYDKANDLRRGWNFLMAERNRFKRELVAAERKLGELQDNVDAHVAICPLSREGSP